MEAQAGTEKTQTSTDTKSDVKVEDEKVLCPHCKRTATNGIKCQGICVSDNGY
jgi:NMD protein affecting ribosome stability and mRNA decay